MKNSFVFYPARFLGMLFHTTAIVFFSAAAIWGLWQAAQANIGPIFLLYLLPALLASAAVPFMGYTVYALQTASYAIERDGMRMRWGLRYEDIPMDKVLWVHSASDLTVALPLPLLRWPGALSGVRRLPGTEISGAAAEVEFLASNPRQIVLVGTKERIFAISPDDPEEFLQTYQRFTEMGSLFPLQARSVHPTFLLGQVWAERPARALWLAGLALSLALLTWVSLVIPSISQVHMGFDPDGAPGDLVPAVRLFLLPVIGFTFYTMDILVGLFFFGRQESRPFSYLVWASGVLTPLLALLALFFILRGT